MSQLSDRYMSTIPMKPYDMVREGLIVFCGIATLVFLLAAIWGFPHIPPLTMQEVATKAPVAFTERTLALFTGQDDMQTYGPPYTGDDGNAQRVGPICPACWVGKTRPTDFRQAMVMKPLARAGIMDPAVEQALASYRAAAPARQKAWNGAYSAALAKASARNGKPVLKPGDYGPVPVLMDGMLRLARAGLLEGALNQSVHPEYAPYNTDYTLSLFYMGGDGIYGKVADHFDEQGNEWGMSHLAGPYPGAWWLWPYTFLYQIPVIGNSPNADLIAGMIVAFAALTLFFLPFVPGLRRLPKIIPVYRLIWRDWYRNYPSGLPNPDKPSGAAE